MLVIAEDVKVCPYCHHEFTYEDLVKNLKYSGWCGFNFYPIRMPVWKVHKYCSLWCAWAKQGTSYKRISFIKGEKYAKKMFTWLRNRLDTGRYIKLSDITLYANSH